MFGRIFGRGKDESDQAVCADCGRTLLAGEWTQKVVDDDGGEVLICSLCGQSNPRATEEVQGLMTTANAGRVRDSRSDSDAFWRALKDKDAEIERLQARLARAEAEKQELTGRLALLDSGAFDGDGGAEADVAGIAAAGIAAGSAAHPDDILGEQPDALAAAPHYVAPVGETADMAAADGEEPELAAATWGETPEELAAALAEFDEPGAAGGSVGAAHEEDARAAAAGERAAAAAEDTQPLALEGDDGLLDGAGGAGFAGLPGEPVPPAADIEPVDAEAEAAELEAAAASLTLLQRGVDLLNVSNVPRKIAETNEQLGLPSVHVGFDGSTVAVTFLWSMGWYSFVVDDAGVRMADRGYDQRTDLQPNAGVRGDGTVQLAPAQISRAAAQRPQPQQQYAEPEPAPAPDQAQAADPEPPSVAAQKPPEILSKSLLGQRSDDEAASWEGKQARDFNWDR